MMRPYPRQTLVLYADPSPVPAIPDLVPSPALREIAAQFRRMAQTYDDEADRRERQAKTARPISELMQDWPQEIETGISAGLSVGDAIRALAVKTGADVSQIDAVWRHHCRKAKRRDALDRATVVRLLKRARVSNKEIGRLVGVHEKSVPRIARRP